MLPLVIPDLSGSQFQHQVVFKTQATYYEGRDQVSIDVKWSWVIFSFGQPFYFLYRFNIISQLLIHRVFGFSVQSKFWTKAFWL